MASKILTDIFVILGWLGAILVFGAVGMLALLILGSPIPKQRKGHQ